MLDISNRYIIQHQFHYNFLHNTATNGSLVEDKNDEELRTVSITGYHHDAFWVLFVLFLFFG